jgi:hypothetical protein
MKFTMKFSSGKDSFGFSFDSNKANATKKATKKSAKTTKKASKTKSSAAKAA